jgi:ribonuclease E
MKRMLINAAEELRVALTVDGRLNDLMIERASLQERKSNIYKGKISSIEPSLEAVFVDYGAERHGFLPLKEISPEYFLCPVEDAIDNKKAKVEEEQAPESEEESDPDNETIANAAEQESAPRRRQRDRRNTNKPNIERLLKRGQEIVIQVEKDERGTKGAALTTFISLAGAYLVLMPNNPKGGGISRRIEGAEREKIKASLDALEVPEGMSVIIRTAGVDREATELGWDLASLLRYWNAIKQAAVAKAAPYLIHKESDTLIRALRDYFRESTHEVYIDDKDTFERAQEYIASTKPDLSERIKHYTGHTPMFSHFQVEKQIETAYQREIRLPSGGSIVIDHTEALVSVDVNSARATSGGNIEETALNINLEAAEEVAKQMRIRDIGGLIVIDFIDMMASGNQRKVEEHLRKALSNDRARIQFARISRFGLLEMSRQRLRSSLSKVNQIPCPRCAGHGTIRSVESMALSIIHLMQEQASKSENTHYQIQLPINVATYLMNEKRDSIMLIEQDYKVQITIAPNQHLESPQYHIKRSQMSAGSARNESYKLVKAPKIDASVSFTENKPNQKPAINEFLANTPEVQKRPEESVIKRLWNIMFGAKEAPKPQQNPRRNQNRNRNQGGRNNNQRRRGGQQRQARDGEQRPQRQQRRPRDGEARQRNERDGEQRPQRQQRMPRDDQSRPERDGEQRPQRQQRMPRDDQSRPERDGEQRPQRQQRMPRDGEARQPNERDGEQRPQRSNSGRRRGGRRNHPRQDNANQNSTNSNSDNFGNTNTERGNNTKDNGSEENFNK